MKKRIEDILESLKDSIEALQSENDENIRDYDILITDYNNFIDIKNKEIDAWNAGDLAFLEDRKITDIPEEFIGEVNNLDEPYSNVFEEGYRAAQINYLIKKLEKKGLTFGDIFGMMEKYKPLKKRKDPVVNRFSLINIDE